MKKPRGENNDLEKKILTFAPDLELIRVTQSVGAEVLGLSKYGNSIP